jgi:hypothetical protein
MSETNKIIEDTLESLKDTHISLGNDIKKLTKIFDCEREELADLPNTMNKFYKLHDNITKLLITVLDSNYSAKVAKEDLIKLRLVNALKRGNGERGMVEWFVEKIESKKD